MKSLRALLEELAATVEGPATRANGHRIVKRLSPAPAARWSRRRAAKRRARPRTALAAR